MFCIEKCTIDFFWFREELRNAGVVLTKQGGKSRRAPEKETGKRKKK